MLFYPSLLLILLCKTTQILSLCTGNFPTQQQIQDSLTGNLAPEQQDTLLLFPSLNFTCDTIIDGWIMAGVERGTGNGHPNIQTWRLDQLNQYRLISNTSDIVPTNIGDSLYQYTLDTPLSVVEGDIMGIAIPSDASIVPQFLNGLFDEYLISTPDRMFLSSTTSPRNNTLFPLVTPVIIEPSIISTVSSSAMPSSIPSISPTASLSSAMSVDTTMMTLTSSLTESTPSTVVTSTQSTTLANSISSMISLSSIVTTSPTTTSSSPATSPASTSIMLSTSSDTPTVIMPSSSMSSTTPNIGVADSGNLPSAVIAGSAIAFILILVIIGLVFVLVLLFALDRRIKNKGEVASPPDESVGGTGTPFDNPNYTAVDNNVQLISVQTTSSTLTGDHFTSHYEIPGYSDPITSPTPILYENNSNQKMYTGIYADSDHYELEPSSFNSQTVLYNDHYEMGSSFDQPTEEQPYSVIDNTVNHYEMELSNSGGIYEQEGGDASGYERPVSSRNNTIVRDPQQPPTNKYRELTSPAHDYSVLDGNIFVPSEEERDIIRQRSAVFDEQSYAQLGIIQKQKYENLVLFEKADSYWKPSTKASLLYDQLSMRKFREIPRSNLRIIKHLGSGQFGTVNEGVWSTAQSKTSVAVKLVSPSASETEKVKLLQEGAIMGQFDHRNVVRLHGVVTVGEPVMIVIELMPKGDLRNYLKIVRQELTQSASPLSDVSKQLIKFCIEVAKGMDYLSDKSFVHRDLAARNIFLTEDLTCKIGDFGMSRDLDDENYYVSHGGKIPVKWTAPEALQFKKYSPLSDVWSYGALMYETWSLAHKPFEGFSNPQTIDLVQSGYRLPPPPGCPRSMYQLMIHCWHPDSSRRPKFSSIIESLSEEPRKLLSWRDIDKAVHFQASVLGAPLEAGQDLYPELQQTFIRSTIKIK